MKLVCLYYKLFVRGDDFIEILITIIITFITSFTFVTLWHNRSIKIANNNILFFINGLISELDEMAKELEEEDFADYISKKKGTEYSYNVNLNLINTIKYLTNK